MSAMTLYDFQMACMVLMICVGCVWAWQGLGRISWFAMREQIEREDNNVIGYISHRDIRPLDDLTGPFLFLVAIAMHVYISYDKTIAWVAKIRKSGWDK